VKDTGTGERIATVKGWNPDTLRDGLLHVEVQAGVPNEHP
jgi:hypothetical protein